MALEFILAGSQIDGARDYQEDAFLITNLTDSEGNPSALIVVADGMGGHAAGNVASNMAVQAFNKHVSANYPSDTISKILHQSVIEANDSIRETVTETSALSGMGCTMVASILEGGKLWWASVGDSHLYLVRNQELVKQNADHSYGGFLDRMQAAGTPVEPEPGLSRNMLMSAITGEDINEIDVPGEPLNLETGDKIIICSDGMDTLSADKIMQYAEGSDSPKQCADALMTAVGEANAPRQDNTTAVVVYVKAAKAAAKPKQAHTDSTLTDRPAESPPHQAFEVEAESRGGFGKIIGIIASIAIAAAAAYFVLEYKKTPAPVVVESEPQPVVEIEETEAPQPEQVAAAPETVAATKEQPAAAPETVAATEEQPAAEEPKEKPEEKAAPTPVQQPATVAGKAGSTFQDQLKSGGKGPEMIIIPGGTFQMGSSGASRHADERPRHAVKVDSFAVSRREITFAEYDRFVKAAGRKRPDNIGMDRATYPVIFVSWDDAFSYAKWLSKETNHKYRLPTESHWEYVASTGKKSPFWWGYEEEPGRAHCFGCGTGLDPRKPTRTGSFAPNAFGVYDTAGNVREWVHDCWHKNYKGAPSDAEIWEGGDCTVRVVRGGSYSTPAQSIRHAKRDKYKSSSVYDDIGIRLIRELN